MPNERPKVVPPKTLERAAVLVLNRELMKLEFKPLRPTPAFVRAECPLMPRGLAADKVLLRAPAEVDAPPKECHPGEVFAARSDPEAALLPPPPRRPADAEPILPPLTPLAPDIPRPAEPLIAPRLAPP